MLRNEHKLELEGTMKNSTIQSPETKSKLPAKKLQENFET